MRMGELTIFGVAILLGIILGEFMFNKFDCAEDAEFDDVDGEYLDEVESSL